MFIVFVCLVYFVASLPLKKSSTIVCEKSSVGGSASVSAAAVVGTAATSHPVSGEKVDMSAGQIHMMNNLSLNIENLVKIICAV